MLRIGSRAQVMHGTAKMTGGGLKKKDLKYNKQGKIVSKKMSAMAKKEKRLQKAGYTTKKGQFGAVKIMKGGYTEVPRIKLELRNKIPNTLILNDNTTRTIFYLMGNVKLEDKGVWWKSEDDDKYIFAGNSKPMTRSGKVISRNNTGKLSYFITYEKPDDYTSGRAHNIAKIKYQYCPSLEDKWYDNKFKPIKGQDLSLLVPEL